jgi:hypothetical protein
MVILGIVSSDVSFVFMFVVLLALLQKIGYSRNSLFIDWYQGKEQLEEMVLTHTRRISQKQKGAIKYKPLSKADLLHKYHQDEVYVDKLMADCKKRGAYRKDCFAVCDFTVGQISTKYL